jgi:hypothetical protein
MSDDAEVTLPRFLPRVAFGLAGAIFLLTACAPAPSPTRTSEPTPVGPSTTLTTKPSPQAMPSPSTLPGPSATPAPVPTQPATRSPSVVPTPDPFANLAPLPADLRLPQGEFTVRPESVRGLAMSTIVPYDLGHCGIYSPVDLDGSLWEPVAGTDGAGGPIDLDAEVGQLINGTPGEVLLVAADRLDWRATQGSRVVVVFRRLPGERAYPGCM